MSEKTICFPNIGLTFEKVGKTIDVFGFEIAYYGIIIALAMACGIALLLHVAKKTGQDEDQYFDVSLLAIVAALLGARIYYVVFSWEYYKDNLLEVFNFRGGGLAIYGGVIAGALTVWIYTRVKKQSFGQFADTICVGLVLGQVIGRWGNFFNREAFGGYTNNLLAMALPKEAVRAGEITQEMLEHITVTDGVEFIQVHPTFLYESLWNLALLFFLLWFTGRKHFHGEVFLLYLTGYGIGRAWIEGLRTDQLLMPVIRIPVSQALSILLVVVSVLIIAVRRKRERNRKKDESNRKSESTD